MTKYQTKDDDNDNDDDGDDDGDDDDDDVFTLLSIARRHEKTNIRP